MDNEKIAERIAVAEQSGKSAHKRIDNIERLTEGIYTLANETKELREDVNRLQNDVDSIKAKPAKYWEMMATTMVTAIVSSGVGYILAKML